MRILAIDDSRTIRGLVLRIVAPYGECSTAADGREAIRAFSEAHAEGRPFDLALLDIYMPGMDGLETLAAIRDLEGRAGIRPEARIRIVMMTTSTDIKNLQESLRRHADAYLPKPFAREAFHKQILALGMVAPGMPLPVDPPRLATA